MLDVKQSAAKILVKSLTMIRTCIPGSLWEGHIGDDVLAHAVR